MSEPLIQLPNGDWVLPSAVTAVTVEDGHTTPSGLVVLTTLTIHHGDCRRSVVGYAAVEEAHAARDLLATTVNAARTEARPSERMLAMENERLRCALADVRLVLMNGKTAEERYAAWKEIGKVLTERTNA